MPLYVVLSFCDIKCRGRDGHVVGVGERARLRRNRSRPERATFAAPSAEFRSS